MQDWRGTEVEIGDTVVYAVAFSSSVTMVEAEVVGFEEKKKPYRDETYTCLRVRRQREAWGWGDAKDVTSKEVVLSVPKRFVVIEKACASGHNIEG